MNTEKYQELISQVSDLQTTLKTLRVYRALPWFFSNSTNLFVVLSLEGQILQMNDPWKSLLGYPENALVETPFLSLVHPLDLPRTRPVWEGGKYLEDTSLHTFYNRYRRQDGSYCWIKWPPNSRGLDNASGYVAAFAEAVSDIRLISALENEFGKTEAIHIP